MKNLFEHTNHTFTAKAALLLTALITLGTMQNGCAMPHDDDPLLQQAIAESLRDQATSTRRSPASSSSSRSPARHGAAAAAADDDDPELAQALAESLRDQGAPASRPSSSSSSSSRSPAWHRAAAAAADDDDPELAQALAESLKDQDAPAMSRSSSSSSSQPASRSPINNRSIQRILTDVRPWRDLLPLPGQLSAYRNVYHCKSRAKTPRGWTCGYHALLNATILEKKLGFDHEVNFESTIREYSRSEGRSPENAATNHDMEVLGLLLNLAPVCNVKFADDGTLEPLASEPVATSVRLPSWLSLFEVQQRMEQALARETNRRKYALIARQQEALEQAGCVHFIGHTIVDGIPHGVLISILKQPDGATALFIFDNMDQPIPPSSPLCKVIEYLCGIFLT